ncbi:MAG TPA: hypothetical protein PK228_10310, partial [Saprospiraceae bacterium]|nr:hypothetical protein [Saprospiraceae bacterium]
MAEIILPGTYITVRDEGLITAGRIAAGNIGIVGTAEKGPVNEVQILGSFAEAKEIFGEKGDWPATNALTLVRSLEYIFGNGGTNVYAVRAISSNGALASYDVKEDNNTAAVIATIKAKNQGIWGNDIKIIISADVSKKKVVIKYLTSEEQFIVANAGELVTQINQQSRIVTANLAAATDASKIPKNTTAATGDSFTGGVLGADATSGDYSTGLAKLENEIINIVLLAGQDASASGIITVLQNHINITAAQDRERIGIIGCSATTSEATITSERSTISSDRIIFAA